MPLAVGEGGIGGRGGGGGAMSEQAVGPNLIRADMDILCAQLRQAGWDAKAIVVEQGNGTIVVGLSAWVSFLPGGGAFPALSPDLFLPSGEKVRR